MTALLETQIEALLFYTGGSMSLKELAKACGTTESAIEESLSILKELLNERGVMLVRDGRQVVLATSPATAALIESVRRDELDGPLGRAGLETLAVIIYRGPVTRADIEYIRGVNVSTTLRSLLIRGLVERTENPSDKRSFLYRTTAELPAYFGVGTLSELPEFQTIADELRAVMEERLTLPAEAVTGDAL